MYSRFRRLCCGAARPCGAVLARGTLASLLVVLSAGAVWAQAFGSVVGTVKDAQGGVVPGAPVVIVNTATNLTMEATTGADGSFNFPNVLSGPYDVKVSMEGFRGSVKSGVAVRVGQISRADFTLELGGLSESVQVSAGTEVLQTDKADVRTELRSEAIVNLPLNNNGNYQALIALVPGSLPPSYGFQEQDNPQRPLSMSVNGGTAPGGNGNTALGVLTRTDGAANRNLFLQGNTIYNPPAETIESVSVSTSSMDAEQGSSGGAVMTVTTKSGTNQLRGVGYINANDYRMNGTPYYFGRGTAPVKLPTNNQRYGGTLGGPIVKNKLFYFGSIERYTSHTEQFVFRSVPDARLRAGDFTQALNANGTLQQVYNPLSGDPNTGTGRQQFPGNVIPANLIDPIALRLQSLYPLPNVEGTGAGNLTNNYREQRTDYSKYNAIDVKVNWNPTSAVQVWGKTSQLRARNDIDHAAFPFPPSPEQGGHIQTALYTLGETWTFGPHLVMDSTVGLSRNLQNVAYNDYFLGNLGAQYGLAGTNDQGRGDPRYAGMPQIQTGLTTIGGGSNNEPFTRNHQSISLAHNVTRIAGSHELKAGYFGQLFRIKDGFQPAPNSARGTFAFNGNATRAFGTGAQTANFYNQYAQFLLGLTSQVSKSYQTLPYNIQENQHALYVRDRWNASSRLTLDFGLRWEYFPLPDRVGGRGLELLDLQTLDVVLGGVAGNPKYLGFKAPKDNFAPRVGVVYRFGPNTVARAGYGLAFDSTSWTTAFQGDWNYPTAINATFLTPAAQQQFGYYGTLAQGIPFVDGPDTSSGRVPLPNSVAQNRTLIPESMERPRIHQWNVSFERQLPLKLNVNLGYVGNKLLGGYSAVDYNPVQHLGGGATDRPYFAQFGRQQQVWVYRPYTDTEYHSMQLAVDRPLSTGLLLKGHYTLSKAMARTQDYTLPGEEFQDLNWNRQGGSRTHVFQMGFVYMLPWQSGKTGGGLVRSLIKDWQVNGIFAAFSGAPFTVTADANAVNTPGNTQTADLVGTPTVIGEVGANGFYIDPAAFGQPTGVRFGNTRINQFEGPGGWNLDASVFRSFPVGGARRLELRFEGQNLTNTPKFGNPTTNITSGDFMRIFSLNTAYPERQIRVGARFSF